MDDELAASGLKRDTESSPILNRPSKKPRDNRLRDCFIITPIEGVGEKISCKYCPDYDKTNKKFNPTKSRAHLTDHCPGVDDALRQVLLESTQAARKSLNVVNRGQTAENYEAGVVAAPAAATGLSTNRKPKLRNRPSPAYISFHTDDTSLDVTAPIVNGDLIIRLTFPTDHLKLNFNAEKNDMEGAALCIDGFMNMKPDASWTASLCSMTSEGTRAGPHCQWSLNPSDISGTIEGGTTRVQKVEKLLKVMVMN
eukprot:CAMPEP_0172299246 /NCGR_PEP_ID=MMETSP1058-20130122/1600_1 /TAXON_ID=83371 /ORGANISM="Detonula confervacea, Strain CCMP 353" /LENGTH=253 /DNA_ID=CAMNT_0013008629 /DNA_START=63 /DNA_END=827 /DNA_ORIENTATION=+